MEAEMMSLSEAAKTLGVSNATMRSRVLRGQIPAEKDGIGEWRIAARHVRTVMTWPEPFGWVMRLLKRKRMGPLSLYS